MSSPSPSPNSWSVTSLISSLLSVPTGKSSLENGIVDAVLIKKTDVIIIDAFAMINANIFLTIEQLCRRYTTKDGKYKAWGGCYVIILFGDPAQLPPVSNADIF